MTNEARTSNDSWHPVWESWQDLCAEDVEVQGKSMNPMTVQLPGHSGWLVVEEASLHPSQDAKVWLHLQGRGVQTNSRISRKHRKRCLERRRFWLVRNSRATLLRFCGSDVSATSPCQKNAKTSKTCFPRSGILVCSGQKRTKS